MVARSVTPPGFRDFERRDVSAFTDYLVILGSAGIGLGVETEQVKYSNSAAVKAAGMCRLCDTNGLVSAHEPLLNTSP
jgi:hypothetical protein